MLENKPEHKNKQFPNSSPVETPLRKNDSSSKRGEEEERKNVINNVIITSTTITKPCFRLIKTFNVAADKIPLWNDFLIIAKREAGPRGTSEVILKALGEYVRRHGMGNNQILLTSYTDGKNPSPHHIICNYIHGVDRDGLVFCTNPSVVKPSESVVVCGMEGKFLNGVYCYACRFNKLRRQEEVKKR